jgi:nucleoside-diphosphate-sugar epimerase
MTTLEHPVILGAGPVGRALAARLSDLGLEPTVVTRSGAALPGARATAADLTDPRQAKEALAGATVVFQAAQPAYTRWPQDFPPLQRSIVAGAEAAGATLVAVENLYGYGPHEGPISVDLPLRATTRKGAVRAALWTELLEAHRAGRLPVAAVRASDFIGPHVEASAYGERFFEPLIRGRKAQVLGDPGSRHSVSYVPDLAATMVEVAADPGAWGRAWHAPSSPAVTQAELVALAAAAAGVGPRHRALPAWMLRLVGRFNPEAGELVELMYEFTDDLVIDWSDTGTRFDIRPTPLEEVMAVTVDWYRTR